MYGKQFKKIRKALNLTQTELAEKLNIKRNSISMIEGSRQNCTIELAKSLFSEFYINPYWFFFDNGAMFTIDQVNDPIPNTDLVSIDQSQNEITFSVPKISGSNVSVSIQIDNKPTLKLTY